jgi:hypothetical protein
LTKNTEGASFFTPRTTSGISTCFARSRPHPYSRGIPGQKFGSDPTVPALGLFAWQIIVQPADLRVVSKTTILFSKAIVERDWPQWPRRSRCSESRQSDR